MTRGAAHREAEVHPTFHRHPARHVHAAPACTAVSFVPAPWGLLVACGGSWALLPPMATTATTTSEHPVAAVFPRQK